MQKGGNFGSTNPKRRKELEVDLSCQQLFRKQEDLFFCLRRPEREMRTGPYEVVMKACSQWFQGAPFPEVVDANMSRVVVGTPGANFEVEVTVNGGLAFSADVNAEISTSLDGVSPGYSRLLSTAGSTTFGYFSGETYPSIPSFFPSVHSYLHTIESLMAQPEWVFLHC